MAIAIRFETLIQDGIVKDQAEKRLTTASDPDHEFAEPRAGDSGGNYVSAES